MNEPIAVGMTREITIRTEKEHTAKYFYQNLPDVFATPFLGGFMERVSAELINEHISPEEQSVGTAMDLKHTAATPLGMDITIKTEVVAVDGAKVTFRLEAFDAIEKIGEAVHERFIINSEKFNRRLAKKIVK